MTPEEKREYNKAWRLANPTYKPPCVVANPSYSKKYVMAFYERNPGYFKKYKRTEPQPYDYNRNHRYYVFKTEAARLRNILLL